MPGINNANRSASSKECVMSPRLDTAGETYRHNGKINRLYAAEWDIGIPAQTGAK